MWAWVGRVGSERGSAILECTLLMPLLVFLAFAPVSAFLVQARHTRLEGLKDRIYSGRSLGVGSRR